MFKSKAIIEGCIEGLEQVMECKNNFNYVKFNLEVIEEAIDSDLMEMANKKAVGNWMVKEGITDVETVKQLAYDGLCSKFVSYIGNKIINIMSNKGYDCYQGEFFPAEGSFKSLGYREIAFVK